MSIPSGQVYLCKNALVDRNYTHTIDFKSPSEQRAYWGSLVKYSIGDFSYIRRKSQFIRVDKNLDELKDINYLFYIAQENHKTYYCFVTSKEYVSDNTTYVYFETDVLQTYMFDYEIKQSYVLQEHTDRWDASHKPIYSRTEENLDYGSEYTCESAFKIDYNYPEDTVIKWYLVICTPHDNLIATDSDGHFLLPTYILETNNPYAMYLVPSSGLKNFNVLGRNSRAEDVTVAVDGMDDFIKDMSSTELGSFVKQIVKLPYLPFPFDVSYNESENQFIINARYKSVTDPYHNVSFITLKNGYGGVKHTYMGLDWVDADTTRLLAEMGVFEGIESALPTAEQWAEIKANPYTTERDKRFESKLLTHPYRYNILSDWKGQPQIIKNEYIGPDKIKINFTQGVCFNAPARYWVEGYKKDPEGRAGSLLQLMQDELPIINDAYYSYMLANRNQIKADQTNAIVSSVSGVAQNLVGGAIFGGGVGAVASAVSGAVNGAVNYQNMVRSQNAKQQDLKNLPDTIINSNDGCFSIFDKNEFITLYRMKICCEFEELLADTFAMTGYTVKRVKVPNLKSRVRFNYIKTVGANIVGSFDQEDLTLIKNIFDNGITFWHYNTVNFKPFDYSLENIETNLL